jgi:hypothetical protein
LAPIGENPPLQWVGNEWSIRTVPWRRSAKQDWGRHAWFSFFFIASNEDHAIQIFSRLKTAGFSDVGVSTLLADPARTRAFAHEQDVTALEREGLGPESGTDALCRLLMSLGIPEQQAQQYEQRLNDSAVMVSVWCEDEDVMARTKAILQECGAADITTNVPMSGHLEPSGHSAATTRS